MTTDSKIQELIVRRQRQLLVHCFLYYKLDETIIDDHTFDAWYKELVTFQRENPEIATNTPYWDICRNFDDSGSGFFIREYPTEISTVAAHLLYRHKKITEPFDHWVSRLGLSFLGTKGGDNNADRRSERTGKTRPKNKKAK